MTHRILIIGVYGFCARHLFKRLISEGKSAVYGADIHIEAPEKLNLRGYSRLDITDKSNVKDVVCSIDPDMIFNLSGVTQGDPARVYQVNFLGSVYLLETVRQWVPRCKVLLVGSAAEYGHVPEDEMPIRETCFCSPFTPNGISKYAMTLAAMNYWRDHGVKVAVARPFNVVGAGVPASLVVGAVLARVKRALKEGNEFAVIPVGNLETQRDFIAVEDVADAYLAMIRSNCWGDVFNICSGVPRTIGSVLEELVSFAPFPIQLQKEIRLLRPTDVPVAYGSWEKAHNAFGFKPKRMLTESLRDMWESAIGEGD